LVQDITKILLFQSCILRSVNMSSRQPCKVTPSNGSHIRLQSFAECGPFSGVQIALQVSAQRHIHQAQQLKTI
jgi:hypothetical protein